MLKKKRASSKDGGDFKQEQIAAEQRQNKLERRRLRSEAKNEQLIKDSKDSYLSLDQFQFLQKNIEMAGRRLKEQQTYIDMMEKRMIQQLEKRRERENSKTRSRGDMKQSRTHLGLADVNY